MTDIAALLVAVPASLIFLALLIRFAVRIDLVDHPVGRKDHGQPVPVVGGIAIWIGLSAGLLAAGPLTPSTSGLILIGAALVMNAVEIGAVTSTVGMLAGSSMLANGQKRRYFCNWKSCGFRS